jgi:hypothetical protein
MASPRRWLIYRVRSQGLHRARPLQLHELSRLLRLEAQKLRSTPESWHSCSRDLGCLCSGSAQVCSGLLTRLTRDRQSLTRGSKMPPLLPRLGFLICYYYAFKIPASKTHPNTVVSVLACLPDSIYKELHRSRTSAGSFWLPCVFWFKVFPAFQIFLSLLSHLCFPSFLL